MAKFQFWLPTNLTRVQQKAVDSREAIFLKSLFLKTFNVIKFFM
jgi:hypothetical protein